MTIRPLIIDEIARDVLACVCAALDEAAAEIEGQPGCPDCRSCLVPGRPAWDGCDNPCDEAVVGGQLSVHLSRMTSSSDLSDRTRERPTSRPCPPQQVTVEFVVTLLRCAPGPAEDGCPPTCAELDAAARVLHVDTATVHNALLCCLPRTGPDPRGWKVALGLMRTLGPEGGCVGIEQFVTINVPTCPCPDEGVLP
ncbi:hypothetical protein [Streptomyces sp. NPDC057250]|uniref:hypothetical protein n=1 Tax=Streptomyces sp. NPDC057250 TaxID=3346068 RepID=UPI00362E1124